jgi:ABC-type transporter Mla subunit MlaD
VSDSQQTSGDNSASDSSSAGTNPIEQILGLLSMVDPMEFAGKAVDTTRRTTEALITILENLASTVDNLNKTTTRVNSLLDEVEEPLRRIMPQMGIAMNTLATMGDVAIQLGELSKRLGPLSTLAENAGGLFGFRPNKPNTGESTTSSSPQTE